MTIQSSFTPPLELIGKWFAASPVYHSDESWDYEMFMADKAAQWGADQQLKACVEELKEIARLQAARLNGDE